VKKIIIIFAILFPIITIAIYGFDFAPNTPFNTTQDSQGILISKGDKWKYFDQTAYPGDGWNKNKFNDATWKEGNAELGYGDGDEKTVINNVGKNKEKFISAYFRKLFEVSKPGEYKTLELELKRDDGAIVYINGTEVYRSNMPAGNITQDTKASSALSGSNETVYVTVYLDSKFLQKGKNLVAVEVHQDNPNSSDLSFDLSLHAGNHASVTRGPYLQSGNPSSIIVKWRTSFAVGSKVYYGTSVNYTDSVVKSEAETDHSIQLSGLQPFTKYYYSISSEGGNPDTDSSKYFFTPPVDGNATPVRIWTMGDFGTTGVHQLGARDAYYNYSKDTYTNLILWLGDDAYPAGTDEQYGTNVFRPYSKILSQSLVYSTSGNHDLFSSNVEKETGPYFDIFSFPKNGECGGLASGSEAYYSFNYGNIHFVCLESNIDSFGNRTAKMLEWLNADLASNKSKWTIAFFHFAIYSNGYHNSDVNKNMIWMRQNVAPVLEKYNTDLVLTGHLHDYERSGLLNGYYGDAASLNNAMIIDKGTGTSPVHYKKSVKGTMYLIAGCMGEPQPVNNKKAHPATVKTYDKIFGTMVIDIKENMLSGKLLTSEGKVADDFVMEK
jgi:hypothetical protein